MKRLFLLCCCLAAAVPFSARGESLERALRAVIDSVRATVGVAVVFGDGDTLAVNGGRCYPMLSVCKFHQALAVLDRLDRRGLPLTTRIPVRRSDLLPGTWSPLREACPGGGRFTVAELLTYSVAAERQQRLRRAVPLSGRNRRPWTATSPDWASAKP